MANTLLMCVIRMAQLQKTPIDRLAFQEAFNDVSKVKNYKQQCERGLKKLYLPKAHWQDFLVWQDANGDGISTEDEVRTLDQLGIESLSLSSDGQRQELADGSVVEHGQFDVNYVDGSQTTGADVSLQYIQPEQDDSVL